MNKATELHRSIRGLSAGLDRKFLRVYFREGAAEAFLDCYLNLLTAEPSAPDVVTWQWSAISSAQECGRTEELVDAVQHTIRFHPELRTARALRDTLHQWTLERESASTSSP